jgi:glutamate 5-kinase
MPDTRLREQIVANARRVVVKTGTNAICDAAGRPDRSAIATLADQLAALRAKGIRVCLVASGAIGAGLGEMGLSERPKDMSALQAVAAVGQGQLMRAFHDELARHDIAVGQLLLTREDFDDRKRYLNIRNTLTALEDIGALPIINENDTVAVDEIRFGENDILAALVTNMLRADLLVLLTSVDGVLDGQNVIELIDRVDDRIRALVQTSRTTMGSGGMGTKLQAASLVTAAGELAVIANARTDNVLPRILAGEKLGTIFTPAEAKMSSRDRWLAQASRPAGAIHVDAGAATALVTKGKSLLPAGIVATDGDFDFGSLVSILADGAEIARGLSNYAASQIDQIKGLKTHQIESVLGDKPHDAVVHRDNMILL